MLRVGNRGLSLIEQMVAVSVLSLGIVLIFEGYFTSLNAFSYSLSRLDVQQWMDEKIWQTQDELNRQAALTPGEHTGSFVCKNKKFDWQMSVDLIEQVKESCLCKLNLTVFWKEPQRNVSLSKVAYVQN